jgi:glycyl-tRNA synthetase beta subunit
VLEISVYDNENNLINQGTGFCVKDSLQYALSASVQDEEKLSKFLKVVKTYTEIQELTPEILNSFIEKIYIGETERYDGKKMQEVEIIYKFVGAINLPQYGSD